MGTPAGNQHKPEPPPVDGALSHGYEAVHDGHDEAPQLRLHHQVSGQVRAPHKALVRSLVERELKEVGLCLGKEGVAFVCMCVYAHEFLCTHVCI